MTITTRLGLTFFAMSLLTLGVGALDLVGMRKLDQVTTQVVEVRFKRVELAERGVGLINANARLALHLFLVADPAEFDREIVNQVTRSKQIRDINEEFESLLDSEEERRLFEDIKTARRVYTLRRSEAESVLRAGYREESRVTFEADVEPKLREYIRSWDVLLAFERARMGEAARDAAATYARARAITLALLAATLALAAAVSVFMTRRITRPILEIVHAAQLLQHGVLARVDVTSGDELGTLADAFNTMGDAVVFRHEQLQSEMKLAQHIQTALLPKNLQVRSLDVSAAMRPADAVGGDYYDVLPVHDGCWLGMGDVAGHGLDAGLIMLMIQASVATLVRENPDRAPRTVLSAVNEVVYENLNQRLGRHGHATMVLVRFTDDGQLTFAGAHEEFLVWRAKLRQAEIVDTPGTWIGGAKDVAPVTVDTTLALGEGDVLVLFSDGLTEACNEAGEMFGIERLSTELDRVAADSVSADVIRARLMGVVAEWSPHVADDRSLVVARYAGRPTVLERAGDVDDGP